MVIGPRKCGKTSWFADLAADPTQDVVLWKVLRVARARTTDEVWSDLWKLLGFSTHGAGDDPIEHLEMGLEIRGRGLTLVVDDWDRAIEERGASVSDACYEVLDALARFCIDQARERDRSVFLGLVLLTSLRTQLTSSTSRRPHSERPRAALAGRHPVVRHLALPDAGPGGGQGAARRRGARPAGGRVVADACGGWLGLLQEAARVVRDHDGSPAEALGDVRDLRLPSLLDDSVYKWLALRPEVGRRHPPEYLEQHLADGTRRRTSACRTTSTTPAGRRH